MVDFNTSFRLNVPIIGKCEVFLGETLKEVKVQIFGNSAM